MSDSIKEPYRVKVPDIDYWRGKIGCTTGCPVKTDARGYVIAIAEGRYEDAYRIARAPNPFASMCGRICGAPCEVSCTRGKVGVDTSGPVAIRALKRFATEVYGVERVRDLRETLESSNARGSAYPQLTGEKIAIIGAGVAGMTVAHDLARLGYRVTVFEALATAGGQMAAGVPIYRLDRELMNLEIAAICELGVDLRLNTPVGSPGLTIPDLRNDGYKAIVIASGMMSGRKLTVPGADADGVLVGIEFLRDVNLGRPVETGERVVVVGGGNVAMDVTRTSIRTPVMPGLSRLSKPKNYAMTDVARLLARTAKTVDVVVPESRIKMPADEYEIEEALLEGARLHNNRMPVEILKDDNGHVRAMVSKRVISLIDASGRFNPQLDDDDVLTIECDTVLVTISQMVDWNFLTGVDNLKRTPRGTIEIDPDTLQTSEPDIWAVGDIALGARLFIDAIASGQRAALAIDEALTGKTYKLQRRGYMRPLPIVSYDMPAQYDAYIRQEPPEIRPAERSAAFDLVEFNFTEKAAREQGMRCLRCHINVVFDAEKCILCGLCINICPESILKMVPVTEVAGDVDLARLIESKYGVPQEALRPEDGTVMLMDGTKCIRCALCAKICPVNCISMEAFEYEEQLVPLETPSRTTLPVIA
ncbi:MAG: FAD-dependent oxidoreductase [Capsulimonadaceae bacterium]|nr:FAD-dependent oxidoreductase [Capsulimonadaceae bacterium]